MRSLLAFAVLLTACTSTERALTVESEGPPPIPPRSQVEVPPSDVVPRKLSRASYWQWDEIGEAERWPELPAAIPGAAGRYRVAGTGPLILELEGADGRGVFSRELHDSQHHDSAAMAIEGDAVFIVHHGAIATGAVLTRIDARTGVVAWRTSLIGAGPIGHSKYRNRVQIAMVDHRPVVYGNESYGKYTEVVDPVTGETVEHGVPVAALADAPWRFDHDLMAAPPAEPATLTTRGGRFAVTESNEPGRDAAVSRHDDAGRPMWTVALPGWSGCGRTAMLEIDATLWVARWCAMASGASVLAIDAERGTVRAQRGLRALPDIVHSAYRAELEIREIDGHPVVFGAEVGGRYIEALDPITGATIVSRTFK